MKPMIINTWNGGAGGRKVVFIASIGGVTGHNQCMAWIHKNTSFSFHEATHNQGYKMGFYRKGETCPTCGITGKLVYVQGFESSIETWRFGIREGVVEMETMIAKAADDKADAFEAVVLCRECSATFKVGTNWEAPKELLCTDQR